ncbi:NAD-dependent epimerase/dehydratase family protein [Roseospira navarrensis]|uniref:NAD-dependent epimerase/dehydratase family protein n=1 Tax=Roseospira navarrensis TaxID=140058 RepID=A0A7X2D411_9PROT|nr:NAD-dependent epimerase/dehydratase family protein [Roseospira navarrensis]MQX37433.1 NAD-dependent epimerase/dehydratase family protein [Roseospira navarrensis]
MGDPRRAVAVTGATGFIGRALCRRLLTAGRPVVALTRGPDPQGLPDGVEVRPIGDLADAPAAPDALEGVDAVVHLAARVHVMRPTPADADAFHRVNVTATERLAEAAAARGLRRMVFVSTAKVHGEGGADTVYTADDPLTPEDAYGRSKATAETALRGVESRTGLPVTILRPPLVYGPGVRANAAALARLCDTPWPLPFGAVRNARSLIALDTLADAIAVALDAPAAAGRSYLVRDGEDVSTAELIRRIRRLQGRPARLVPVPPGVLTLGLRVLGKGGVADRLFGSFRIDDAPIRRDLGWTPPLTLDEGLARMLAGEPPSS